MLRDAKATELVTAAQVQTTIDFELYKHLTIISNTLTCLKWS